MLSFMSVSKPSCKGVGQGCLVSPKGSACCWAQSTKLREERRRFPLLRHSSDAPAKPNTTWALESCQVREPLPTPAPLSVVILPIPTAAGTAVGPEPGYLFLGSLLSAQLHCFPGGEIEAQVLPASFSLQASLSFSSTGQNSSLNCETGKATTRVKASVVIYPCENFPWYLDPGGRW